MCFFRKKKKEAKPVAKEEPKKVETSKKEEPKVVKAAPKKEIEEKKEPKKEGKRVYHVSKREEDGMWQVKYAGGEKAIKLFKTKAEAAEYCEKMAENQDGVVLYHNSKGANKGRISK